MGLEGLLEGNSLKVIFEANPVWRLTPVQPPMEMALLANRNYPTPARLAAAHRILKWVEECGGR